MKFWCAGTAEAGDRPLTCCAARFPCLQAQLKLVIDSIVWAFRHTERNIADTGAPRLLGWVDCTAEGCRWLPARA